MNMKRIYIYMAICLGIGVLMAFKSSIRQWFSEDLTTPTAQDLTWTMPQVETYPQKVLLELQYFTPMRGHEMVQTKINELRASGFGIHTILLSGSAKIDTNTYLRVLAQRDWGIVEIRLHSTSAINTHAFMNLMKANYPTLERVLIWNNGWDDSTLNQLRALLPNPGGLALMKP